MSRPRDTQRKKVYTAEAKAGIVAHDPNFETVAECQAFVDAILQRQYIRKHYPTRSWGIHVTDGRGSRRARAHYSTIQLPKWARSRGVILHELAHCFADMKYGYDNIAGHGWEWCEIYLDLVRHVLGADKEAALKAAFREHKVRFRPKRKVNMTEEQKDALRQRARAALAARTKEGT